MDGIEVCRKLRKRSAQATPVLMLTARDSLDSSWPASTRVRTTTIKPFALQEVEVRLNALARRGKGLQTRVSRSPTSSTHSTRSRSQGRASGAAHPTALKILHR